MPKSVNSFVSLLGFVREVAQPGRALESTNKLGRRRRCRGLPTVGFILACLGHRYRAVAGSNPALPTKIPQKAWFYLQRFAYFCCYDVGNWDCVERHCQGEKEKTRNQTYDDGFWD